MLPLIVLVSVFAVLRLFLKDWRLCLRWALAVMLLVTASGHWGLRRPDLVAMVPPAFPNPELLATLTGILELAGAMGLVWTRTSRLAAICLAILFVAMFPANVYAARHGLTIAGAPVTALPLRTFVQLVLIASATAVAWGPPASRRLSPQASRLRPECRRRRRRSTVRMHSCAASRSSSPPWPRRTRCWSSSCVPRTSVTGPWTRRCCRARRSAGRW